MYTDSQPVGESIVLSFRDQMLKAERVGLSLVLHIDVVLVNTGGFSSSGVRQITVFLQCLCSPAEKSVAHVTVTL